MAKNQQFIELIGPTQKQFEEKFLEELVLRFVALLESGTNVTKSISVFLTDFMEQSIRENSLDFKNLEEIFSRVIHILSSHGRDIFRGRNGIFSSSLYDGIMIGIAKYVDIYESDPALVVRKIANLKSSDEFQRYSGSASSSKERVIGRINTAIEIFKPSVQ